GGRARPCGPHAGGPDGTMYPMLADPTNRQLPEELHALLLKEVQTLRGCLSRLEQVEQERHQAEEARRQEGQRLHERDKLEAIGRLAGGIAHQVNSAATLNPGRTRSPTPDRSA